MTTPSLHSGPARRSARRRGPRVLLPLGLFLGSCASGAPPCVSVLHCSEHTECLANRCVPKGGEPVPRDSQREVLRPTRIGVFKDDVRAFSLPATVNLGSQRAGRTRLYLSFEGLERERTIHSAFLVLTAAPGEASPSEPLPVRVLRVQQSWQAEPEEEAPAVGLPSAEGWARPSALTPLRVDVTDLVRFLQKNPRDNHGMSLEASADHPLGVSYETGTRGRAPELEIYYLSRPQGGHR